MVLGRASRPLGEITLPVEFGTASNFRVEHINIYVANFNAAYHAILGRLALAKFMAIPHYAYLVLKMPSPAKVSPSPKPPTSPSKWPTWSMMLGWCLPMT